MTTVPPRDRTAATAPRGDRAATARRPPIGAALAVAAALAGCGPDGPPTGRLAVVQRGLDRDAVRTGPEPEPLAVSWRGDDLAAAWSGAPSARLARGPDGPVVVLSGTGRVALETDVALDADVLHTLLVTTRVTGARRLVVQWRRHDEAFAASRSSAPFALEGGESAETVAVPIAALRGSKAPVPVDPAAPDGPVDWVRDRDAVDGFDALRLVFRGDDGSAVRVEVGAIVLASDFDASGLPEHRLVRDGVQRTGVVLRVPGAIETPVDPGPHDRLRMAFALAGSDRPVPLRLTDDRGRLPETGWTLAPEARWREVAVDLSPLGGEPATLRLAADDAAGARATVLVGGIQRLAPRDDEVPNVLLYVEDTLRADRLGTYGYDHDTDPFLSRLAAAGVVFERTIAASNWTRPSISSMLTGLDPFAHGNDDHTRRVGDGVTTLAEVLAEAGWVTASFVTNYHGGSWSGLDQGFDLVAEPSAVPYVASSLTSAVLHEPVAAFLAEHADERVLVSVHSVDPHSPYRPEARDLEALAATADARPAARGPQAALRFEQSLAYDAEILHNDRQLARLDAELASLGLVDETLFVVTSDHGEGFAEHGTFEHREQLFQEELAVPWVMRWPNGLPAGRRVDATVGHVDLAPTLVGLAGLVPPAAWQGRDLSALARGETTLPAAPVLAHVRHTAPRDGARDHLAVVHGTLKLLAVLDDEGRASPRALFDLAADPGESIDLIDDPRHADAVASMLRWAERRARGRERAAAVASDAMDPATLEWMREMGYLGVEEEP